MKNTLLFIFFLCVSTSSFSQGKLLLIGGGSENITSTTSWNYDAFNWAVAQSNNKKVAILHYSTTTSSDFENYFKNYCGAAAVKSFIVSSANANSSALINEINEYDVFYFRGGDQWYYYTDWRGTLMEDLIQTKYNNGGVICGTSAGLAILSGVMFTAQYSSAYSDLTIKNTNHIAITLVNNFLELMPGFIFDSHFTDRGRMGRLVSFMANWKKNHGEDLVGIGVDEISALAVNSDLTATAYGAGSVDIFRLREGSDFKDGTILNVDSLEVTHLIQGKTIDLNSFSVGGFTQSIEQDYIKENSPSKIYLSGSDNLQEANIALLEQFVNDINVQEPVIIFSESTGGIANDFKNKIIELGNNNVDVYIADNSTSNDVELKNAIESTNKFIFVDNSAYDLVTLFLQSGNIAGNTLKHALETRPLTLAFIGDNARFAGSAIVSNYLGTYANASTSNGLNLLKTVVIIPKTYERSNDGITTLWHATNASLPYAMAKERIKNGIWLNDENYIVFQGIGDVAKITAFGNSPVMILTQNDSKGELVSQTYSGTGSPDKKAGFDKMYLSFIKENQTYTLGDFDRTLVGINPDINNLRVKVYPNPVVNELNIESEKEIQLVSIYDIIGNLKYQENFLNSTAVIDIQKLNLKQGLYLVEIRNWEDEKLIKKILVK